MRALAVFVVAVGIVAGQAMLSSSVIAQEKSCTQIASNARNWLIQNPNSKAYSVVDVQKAFKECMRTGYWTNVSKPGGQPARKQ